MSASGTRLDELGQWEEQRRFLLRSLDDLERERAAGDIDDDDYEALKADYTDRAADVIRRIEGGVAEVEATAVVHRAKVPTWRRPLIAVAVLAVAVGSGVLVARSAGEREAGQVITGGTGGLAPGQKRIADLLTRARDATRSGDPLTAIESYDQVAKLDPTIAEAWTYGGWQLRIVATQAADAQKPSLLAGAKRRLQEAIRQDPAYPDAYAFLAVISLRDENNPKLAKGYLEQLDKLTPGPDVMALTAGIRAEVGLPPTTATTTVKG